MLVYCRILIAWMFVLTASTLADDLVILDAAFDGKFASMPADDRLRFSIMGRSEPLEVAADQLVRFGVQSSTDVASGLLMIDGSFVAGRIGNVDPESVTLGGRHFQVDASQQIVRGFALQLPSEVLPRIAFLNEMMNADGGDDVLLTVNGDQFRGVLQAPVSEANPFRSAPLQWRLKRGDQFTEVAANRLRGIVLSPILHAVRPPEAGFWFSFSDGSHLAIESIDHQVDEVLIKLHCGQTIRFTGDWESFIAAIVGIETVRPIKGTLVDRRPLAFKQESFSTQLEWPMKAATDSPYDAVLVAGNLYRRTISMHSNAQAVYAVEPQTATFSASVGVARTSATDASPGSVIFQVLTVDATKKPKLAVASPVVRSGDPPVSLTADVRGAKLIVLVVSDAEDGSAGDHGVWINPRFSGEKD
ncbi:MAG: NPCBM/NEW2 domain-containing protein [Pirellulaceae bacterium]